MKRILYGIFALILSMLFVLDVNAANATIAVSSSTNQVIVGKDVTVYVTISSSAALGSWEYTLNYDNSVFKLVSSDVALHYASYASNANTKSVSYKYVFRALKSASSKFYVDSSMAVAWDESILGVNNGSKVVKTLTYSEYQASLSANNNLKSLAVDGYEITPQFNKDNLEYSVKVNEDETKIKIIASAEDKTATISGAGEVEVSAGNNVFNITVIAQNGSEKTYKLNVDVVDKDPIEVTVSGEKYTIVKLASNLTKPESYVEKIVNINEYEIPAFYSEVTEFTLVGLKDENGNIALFIYENDEYIKYVELNFGNITIYPKEMKETIEGYVKYSVTIQDTNIEALSMEKDSRFKLIYGLNVETKEDGLYIYDTKDNTLVKYDDTYIKLLEEKIAMLTYSTFAFVASTVLALFGIIALSKRKGKKTKRVKKENHPKEINDNLEYTKELEIKDKKVKIKNDDTIEDPNLIVEKDSKDKKQLKGNRK